MPDTKDEDSGFLSRVYRFVNSPRTEWGGLDSGLDDSDAPSSRSELQIMIERKRRNDFVRRQEFGLLRRIRDEGITAAQLRAHGAEGEYAKTVAHGREDPPGLGVTLRSKIDQLEKTMVLSPRSTATVRESPEAVYGATETQPPYTAPVPVGPSRARQTSDLRTSPRAQLNTQGQAPRELPAAPPERPSRWHALVGDDPSRQSQPSDPVLEEAAFAFASADFVSCEVTLRQLVAPGAVRERDIPTWLTLLDLYRATGQQQRFDATAAEFRGEFGLESGPWESVPRLAAGAVQAAVGRAPAAQEKGLLQWVCPAFLDGRAISVLSEWCQTRSRRRYVDWSALQMIDGQAAASLAALMSEWVSASMDWHWNGIDRLFDLLEVAAPPGDRSADPTFWRLRLVALQLLGRRKEFLSAAAEMQALYGDASPAWETPRRVVRQGTPSKDAGGSEFMVSTMPDALGRDRAGRIDLAGQLTGDIASALARCDSELREAEIITVDCTRLIRVDFVAAGELINWVAEQRARQRLVHFRQLHRLLALFFRAMGLDEHATLEMRGTSSSAGMAS